MNRDLLELILVALAALSLLVAVGAMIMARRLWVQAASDARRIQSLEAQNAALTAVINKHYPNELAQAMQAQASVLGLAG
jgi:hypothetical protein